MYSVSTQKVNSTILGVQVLLSLHLLSVEIGPGLYGYWRLI
jgi:hypothetical protein